MIPHDMKWLSNYYALLALKKEQKTMYFTSVNCQDASLLKWIRRQVDNELTMLKWRKKQLDEVGFLWKADIERVRAEISMKTWRNQYDKLKAFYQKNGHSIYRTNLEDQTLARWVIKQRRRFLLKDLTKEHIRLLNEIDFVWNTLSHAWEKKYKILKEFKKKHGHCHVKKIPANKTLHAWVELQRNQFILGKMPNYRKKKLEEIGFVWNVSEWLEEQKSANWMKNYEKLKSYYQKNGSADMMDIQGDADLKAWIAKQRHSYAQNWLKEKYILLLNDIDFVWKPLSARWMKNFEKLKKFQQQYGHCTLDTKQDLTLRSWTDRQRHRFKNGKLSEKRIELLNSINFSWAIERSMRAEDNQMWLEKYNLYKSIFIQNKTQQVDESTIKELKTWAAVQKQLKSKGVLLEKRIDLLNQIGFDWKPRFKPRREQLGIDREKRWLNNYKHYKSVFFTKPAADVFP